MAFSQDLTQIAGKGKKDGGNEPIAKTALKGIGKGLSSAGNSLMQSGAFQYSSIDAKSDKKGSDYRAGSPVKEEIY